MRQKFIIGNWKMHMTASETESFVKKLLPQLGETTTFVGITPPFTSIGTAVFEAMGSYLNVGAQNMSEHPKGAFTGEISSIMLKESGATFVILGHSERRAHFHEDDQMIHRKVKRALEEDLLPILCVGETEKEREGGIAEKVLKRQLEEALKDFLNGQLENIVIAYEPIWAIGTGKTATPEMAEETHKLIRLFIKEKWGKEISERIPLIYGGSVKPDNGKALLEQPNIDGALIGGASLEVGSFVELIKCGEQV